MEGDKSPSSSPRNGSETPPRKDTGSSPEVPGTPKKQKKQGSPITDIPANNTSTPAGVRDKDGKRNHVHSSSKETSRERSRSRSVVQNKNEKDSVDKVTRLESQMDAVFGILKKIAESKGNAKIRKDNLGQGNSSDEEGEYIDEASSEEEIDFLQSNQPSLLRQKAPHKMESSRMSMPVKSWTLEDEGPGTSRDSRHRNQTSRGVKRQAEEDLGLSPKRSRSASYVTMGLPAIRDSKV